MSLAAFSGDTSTAEPEPQTVTSMASILGECPSLKAGHSDPVNGKNCVRELQTMLKARGYNQPTTGIFAERTVANVKAFQRSEGIPAIGVVGLQTRTALLGGASDPEIPQPTYAKDVCTTRQCTLYLRRSTIRQYAQTINGHPLAVKAVSTAITRAACAQVFKLSFLTVMCQVVADHYTDQVKNAVVLAARQRACLRITVSRPDVATPLAFAPDNSSRCRD